MSLGWAEEPPPLHPEPLDRLREGLGLLLAYDHARDPDDEEGFHDAVCRLTDQLYVEGWYHYGYDQEEGLALLNAPTRIERLDARAWVRLLVCIHRGDYWTNGPSGKTFWAPLVANGVLRSMDRRLQALIAEARTAGR